MLEEEKKRKTKQNKPFATNMSEAKKKAYQQSQLQQTAPKVSTEKGTWYKGSQPTQRETLARIYEVGNQDPSKRESLMQMYQAELNDPASPIYNPYTIATTTSMSKTNLNNTLKAQQEWEELTKELTYWAGRTDRNYSDDEIVARVNWKNYPTLAKMDAGRENGSPYALTEAVGYSKDAMYGVLWAARNPNQSTGDYMLDAVQSVLGRGTQYQRNDQIAERLNPMSKQYNPYAVGSTMDELSYRYGTDKFDQEWLDNNRALLMNEATASDYGKVYNAVQNTAALQAEAQMFNERIERRLDAGLSINIDQMLEDESYKNLRKLNESLKSGQLMDVTEAINFDPYSIQEDASAYLQKIKGVYSTDEYDQMLSDGLGGTYMPDESKQSTEGFRQLNTDVILPDYVPVATDAERKAFRITGNAGYSDVVFTTADLVQNGTGGADQAKAALQKAAHANANKSLFGAWDAINDETTFADVLNEDEQAFLQKYFPEKYAAGELPTMDDFGLLDVEAVDPGSMKTAMDVWSEWETVRGHAESVTADMAERAEAANESRQIVNDVLDDLAEVYGEGTEQYNAAVATYEMAYAYSKGVPKTYQSYDAFQQASAQEGATAESLANTLTNQRGANARNILVLNALVENAEIMGMPEAYIRNMRQQVEDLKTQNDLLAAHNLSSNEDYASQVAAFDAQNEPYKPTWFAPKPGHEDVVRYAVIDWESAIGLGSSEQSDTVMLAHVMTDEERSNYKYIYMTEGPERATAYFDALSENLYVRAAEERSERTQKWAAENELNSAIATVGSVFLTPMEAASALSTLVEFVQTGEVNPYGMNAVVSQMKGDLRTGTKEGAMAAWGEENKVAYGIYSTIYDALTSAADSMVASKFGSIGGAAMMGASAFNSATMDASMRGASGERALLFGAASALIEAGSEKISIDRILGAFDSGASGVRGLLDEIAHGFFSEGAEEMASTLGSAIADDMIMGAMANRETAIAAYMEAGLTREEAEAQAAKDILTDIAYSGLVGGISGSFSSGLEYGRGALTGKTEQPVQTTEETMQATTQEAAPAGAPVQRAEAALATSMQDGVGEAQQAATVSGVMQSFGLSDIEANAAAKYIVESGKSRVLRKLLSKSDDPAGLLQAIAMGSVAETSSCAVILNTKIDSKNAARVGKQLLDAYKADMANQRVAAEYDARIAFSAEADATAAAVTAIEPVDHSAVDAAKEKLNTAQQKQADAEAELKAAHQAVVTANETFQQNPADDKAKAALKQAISAQYAARKSADLAKREAAYAKKNFEQADADFKAKTEANMIAAREQAKAEVQQKQAELEAYKQEAAKAAETQRESDNETALEVDDFISTMLQGREVTDEEREQIKRRLAEKKKVIAPKASDEAGSGARAKFVTQMQKKFGVTIRVMDTTEGGQYLRYNGAYDPKTDSIVIDSQATQSDVIYGVLLHELTHKAERSDTYQEFASAILQIKYKGDDQKLAADIRAKQDSYNSRLKAMQALDPTVDATPLTADQASREIVADLTREILFGDEASIQQLCAEKPGVAKRILETIKNFLNQLRGVNDPAVDQLNRARDLFEQALGGSYTRNESDSKQYMFEGYTAEGKPVYSSNFPEGSTKEMRSARILQLIRDVWSKNPIQLEIERNGQKEIITAQFDPYVPEDGVTYSDATKLAAGNRKGNASDRKVSQKLADDIPDIIRTSKYDHSKDETGGKNEAHDGVSVWHYFTNDIGFINEDGGYADYGISIDVKEKADGDFVYAFAARKEKGSERSEAPDLFSDPETLNAPVNGLTPIIATDIVRHPEETVKQEIKTDSGEVAAEVIRGGVSKQYSLASWTESERKTVRENLIKNGFGPADADKWISDVDSVASIISNDKARLDYQADPDQVMLKNNQEYVKTLDASTLCAKRLLYQGTFNEIQHLLPNTVITSDMLLDLLNMMKDAGYETPCGVCYVESRRRHLGKFAEQWLHGRPKTKEQKAWEPYNGDYIPTLDELTTTDGLAKLKEEHPQTYSDFMKKMASLGSSNPKIVELRTDYRDGLIRKLTKSQIEKIVKIGGLRVQSFSDFETPHLIDMMQAVLDMTSKKLTSQAYTKVPNFAWVFGDTGIKINLSLLAEGNGLDENGNLIFSSSEGMDFEEAMRLRDRYSQNVGTIIVGANDAHIRAAMADPRIDYIIPFHRSGWGQNELKKVGVLQTYTDYQATQNERMLDGSKPEGGNFYPIDYWDYSKTGDENAATYLRMCEEDGRIPKFDQFLTKDEDGHWVAPSGYWKMLIDFKMYDNDGNGAPQQTVQPNFNMEEAVRVLKEYKGGANDLPVAQDIVDRFVADYKAVHPGMQYSLPSSNVLDELIDSYLAQGSDTSEAQAGRPQAQRQFTAQTLPNNENIPRWAVDAVQQNPDAMNYEPDTNRDQAYRGWQRIQQNGYEAERDRLLSLERYSPDDVAEANMIMAMALREDTSDPATFFALASDYAAKGTTAGQELQARKLFSKMTPNGIRVWVAGKLENQLSEFIRTHQPKKKEIDQKAAAVADQIRNLDSSDAMKRLASGEETTIDSSNNRWGVLINEQQQALIDHYKLNDVARPGIFYNRATIKQRMLEAILATPNPLEVTGLGMNLIQRLEYMKDGQAVVTNADLNYIGSRLGEFIGYGGDEGGRDADVAIARAYEAFGNITPASAMEKFRTQRYVNMLLSIPSFTRNIIGNAAQNALNAVSHGGAVLLDTAISGHTGRRTMAFLDAKERIDGWKAFVEETKNTFRDYFIDKVNAAPNQDKYSTNRRARTFQNPLQEATKDLEAFLMSVGDRNVWKKSFVNSLAEQQKLADKNLLFNDDGTTLTHEQMVERAERDANYATFTEDNLVQRMVGDLARRSPVAADVLSLFVPFTGVPTNIMKRSLEYSPVGFVTTVGRYVSNSIRGENFDQQAFVNGMSRAFTGSALMLAGYMLGAAGMITMGSGDEDEGDKVYDAKTARGDQYTPYFYDPTTGANVSMSTFAPAGSPLVWGASIGEALKGDENLSQIMLNALFSSTDSILNASYLSGLSDLFGGYGSLTENALQVGAENLVSQSIPALFTQAANALDPYVRDTKDKDFLTGLMKTTVNRIPGLRNVVLPEKVTVTGETVPTRENRVSNFYDPLTRSTRNDNPALAEVMRLYEAVGTTDVLPSDALRGKKNSFSLKVDGAQMSATFTDEQKAEYRKYYGQLWTEALSELLIDPAYTSMPDEDKAAKVKKIMQTALKEAKTEFLLRYGR